MTATPLLAWGAFQFEPLFGPDKIQHTAPIRWQRAERVARRPAQQFVGVGTETISFTAVVWSVLVGRADVGDELRALAALGEPHLLIEGIINRGWWALRSVQESREFFLPGGPQRKGALKIEFVRYGEDLHAAAPASPSEPSTVEADRTRSQLSQLGVDSSATARVLGRQFG